MTALEPPTTVSEETPGQLCHIQCPLYLFNIFYHLGHWSSYQALDFSDLTSKENGTLWIDLDSNSVSHSFAAINRLNKNSIFARFHFINSRCINITSSIQQKARPFLKWAKFTYSKTAQLLLNWEQSSHYHLLFILQLYILKITNLNF